MFTIEQRDALRDRVLRLAGGDERVVAGAAVGSLAAGGGDRYSDLDLTFAVADRARVAEVLDDWTRTLAGEPTSPTPSAAGDLFGWGVIYALHSRACIERGRLWQAEHYVGAVRDHALSLACLREGLVAVQARGYDDLSAETLGRFADTHIAARDPDALRAALAASVRALLHEGAEARLPHAEAVAQRLAELT